MKDIYFNRIPDDVIEYHIWPQLSVYNKIWLNKKNYLYYHKFLKKYIINRENYMRAIIREDNCFVFTELIKEEINNWLNPHHHINYHNITFKDYLNYIHYILNRYNSNKCKNKLFEYLKNSGIHKKWHKNNTTKNIRWIN